MVPDLRENIIVKDGKRVYKTKKNKADNDAEIMSVRYLSTTLSEAFALFKSEHPNFPHSQRMFEKLRPAEVRCFKLEMRAKCCCKVHTNVQFKVDALNKVK